jgi:hypothetical protein
MLTGQNLLSSEVRPHRHFGSTLIAEAIIPLTFPDASSLSANSSGAPGSKQLPPHRACDGVRVRLRERCGRPIATVLRSGLSASAAVDAPRVWIGQLLRHSARFFRAIAPMEYVINAQRHGESLTQRDHLRARLPRQFVRSRSWIAGYLVAWSFRRRA